MTLLNRLSSFGSLSIFLFGLSHLSQDSALAEANVFSLPNLRGSLQEMKVNERGETGVKGETEVNGETQVNGETEVNDDVMKMPTRVQFIAEPALCINQTYLTYPYGTDAVITHTSGVDFPMKYKFHRIDGGPRGYGYFYSAWWENGASPYPSDLDREAVRYSSLNHNLPSDDLIFDRADKIDYKASKRKGVTMYNRGGPPDDVWRHYVDEDGIYGLKPGHIYYKTYTENEAIITNVIAMTYVEYDVQAQWDRYANM